MGEYDDFDLDRTTTRAWSRFQRELGDHIVAMEDDDITIVEAEATVDEEEPGAAPYAQFCAWGEHLVRAEVSSNEYLAADVMLDDAGEAALLDLGWAAPTYGGDEEPDAGSANFHLDAGRREGDRLAAMTVAALRDVFGVPHPAFLDWPPAQDPQRSGPDPSAGDVDRPDEPLAAMPESAAHLRDLVGAALTPPGGTPLECDEDGDIPLPTGSALLFVRACEEAPVVELFAFVVRGIQDVERASFEVAVLNRDTRIVKFVLLDDAVLATAHLPAMPFAPRQLRVLVSAMAEVIDRVDDDLVARVGGRRGLEPEPEEDEPGEDREDEPGERAEERSEERELHPALLTLIHLDPHGEGVDADLAASVCEYDRDLVLRLLHQAGEQEIEWRRSGNLALMGDETDEARVCFGEAHTWEVTLETLRSALRVIVEQQRAETSPARTDPGTGRGRARSRRRAERPHQQSLVDDAVLRRHSTGEAPLFEEPDS
jgi:hypothetical protein